jgi:hypothetical protein
MERTDLAARMVSAMFVQAARDTGDGRTDGTAVPDIVRAMLRAVGNAPEDAAARAAEAVRHAGTFPGRVAGAGPHGSPAEGHDHHGRVGDRPAQAGTL